jgi:CRP-like cAMP-binding protein
MSDNVTQDGLKSGPPGRAPRLPYIRLEPLRAEGVKTAELDEEKLRRLAAIGTLRRYPAGALLQEEGTPATSILNLIEGVVETYRVSAEGDRRILAFHFPGDLVGLFENGVYVNSARALTPVLAYQFPLGAFFRFLHLDCGVEDALLAKAHQDLREAEHHAIILFRHEAHERVFLLLDLLRARLVREEGGEVILDLPLRRVDLADYLGLSVEAVSRALKRLEGEGLVRLLSPRRLALAPEPAWREVREALV